MKTQSPITAANVTERIAQSQAAETALMVELHRALGVVIKLRGKDILNPDRLWAEFYYAKAMHNLYGDDTTEAMLSDACHELGVDSDGDKVPDLGCDEADYRYDMAREWA